MNFPRNKFRERQRSKQTLSGVKLKELGQSFRLQEFRLVLKNGIKYEFSKGQSQTGKQTPSGVKLKELNFEFVRICC